MRLSLLLFLLFFTLKSLASDTIFIRVHFLYGSTPKKEYKEVEDKWFGGKLGGHVGIEIGNDSIINFVPDGKFHVFQKKDNPHSMYSLHTYDAFYSILGGEPSSNKKAIFRIPITIDQKNILDSISNQYLAATPYDYSLFGMRCGAATYDILAKIGVLPEISYSKTWKKIFYPKKLRKLMFAQSESNDWIVEKHLGSNSRKWERD